MKFSTSALLFVIVVATAIGKKAMALQEDNRALVATLAEKWSISDATFLYNGLDFTFDYDVSNFIDVGQAYYEVYDSGCKEGGNPPLTAGMGFTLTDLVDVATGSVAGDDILFDPAGKTSRVPVGIDVNTIVANTAVYTETGTGGAGDLGATIEFCVRFGLYTLGGTPIEVNFLESVITLTVDLAGGFTIDNANVEAKERLISTASQTYTVEGYMCVPGGNVEVADPAAVLSQGSLITVCIRPNAAGLLDGIKMRTLDAFVWTRGATTQAAVDSGIAADNLLTTFDEITCSGGDYCQFSSILFAAFYNTAGQVSGSGVASMQFGATRRLTANANCGGLRSLQAQDDVAAVTSEFDLSVSIEAADDDGPMAFQTAAGVTLTSTTILAAIAGLVVATIALL
jgi:hypothetical protein